MQARIKPRYIILISAETKPSQQAKKYDSFNKEISSSISYLSVKYRMVCEYVKLLPFSFTDCDWFFQYRAEIFFYL
jgi:hypothetical protein